MANERALHSLDDYGKTFQYLFCVPTCDCAAPEINFLVQSELNRKKAFVLGNV